MTAQQISQRRLASICDIAAGRFNEIINAKRTPSALEALAIERATGVCAEALMLERRRRKVRAQLRVLLEEEEN